MPANGYSVGKDTTLDIIGPSGPLRFAIRTGWDAKPDTHEIKVRRADGITDTIYLPDGWMGSFDFERQNSAIDDYFAKLESDYYNGANIQGVSITQTITEANGGITQYRFVNVALKLDDAGSWKGDDTVKMKISFSASRRIKVA